MVAASEVRHLPVMKLTPDSVSGDVQQNSPAHLLGYCHRRFKFNPSRRSSRMAQNKQMYAQMSKRGPFSVERSGYTKTEGETIPRTNPVAKDKLVTVPSDDVTTIYENLRRAAEKFGNAKAMGTRKLIKTHTETKKVKKTVDGKEQEVDKKWTYFELGPYEYLSFVEYEKMALAFGAGLRYLGMKKDDRLHQYGATRYSICRQ